MYQSLERYIPLFEAYLRSDKPEHFMKQLNDPTEKSVIEILTEDVSDLKEFR